MDSLGLSEKQKSETVPVVSGYSGVRLSGLGQQILRNAAGFRQRAPAALTPAKRLKLRPSNRF